LIKEVSRKLFLHRLPGNPRRNKYILFYWVCEALAALSKFVSTFRWKFTNL